MDSIHSPNSKLLEEVFNEIENSERPAPRKLDCAQKSGFLEDLVNLEKEISSSSKKFRKKKEGLLVDIFQSLQEKSEIHEGLTDSSEDENNKYFEQAHYNECGRNLKKLMKDKTSLKPEGIQLSKTEENSWIRPKPAGQKLETELERLGLNVKSNNELLRDPILNMNIINPLVSFAALKEKLIGRVCISTSKVKHFLETTVSKNSNWVIGGAIVGKFTKTSQKGNPYCVWHLTDLSGDIKTVCVFLFGSAYKEYWKSSLGAVVAILNPVVMDNKGKSEATLRIDNAQKILILGASKDYGLCKSRKKNGENCLSVVNKSKCDYCIYHMKKEYNKACRRSDLQPPKIGRTLDTFRAKILARSQISRGGKFFTGIIGKKGSKQLEKDQQRMKLLSQNPETEYESQKRKDEDFLKKLKENADSVSVINKDILKLSKPEMQMIDLGFTISKKERNAAKANALKYIREHGPLKRLADNEKSKRTPEHISLIKRKLEVEEERKSKKLKPLNETQPDPLQNKYLKNGITNEFLKLMNSETRNRDLLKEAENEEKEKYFNKLELKEKIENKMASTFKVECKAVRCLKCNYKSFSAADLCKKEKHPLKVVNAIKRFWKCGNCSARTVTLELVPLNSCKICGSSKWERASMMPEKKDSNLTKVPLSLRGDEETYLGTSTKQANLNLLVPE